MERGQRVIPSLSKKVITVQFAVSPHPRDVVYPLKASTAICLHKKRHRVCVDVQPAR